MLFFSVKEQRILKIINIKIKRNIKQHNCVQYLSCDTEDWSIDADNSA